MKSNKLSWFCLLLIIVNVIVLQQMWLLYAVPLYLLIVWILLGLLLVEKRGGNYFTLATLLTVNLLLIYSGLFYSVISYSLQFTYAILMLSIEFFISGLEMMISAKGHAHKLTRVRKAHIIVYHITVFLMIAFGWVHLGAIVYFVACIVTVLVGIIYFIVHRELLFERGTLNIPNILTTLRMVLVIPFVYFFYHRPMVALGIFIIASLTDYLDGAIARSTQNVTNYGKIMDPLADKVLVMSAFILLSVDGVFPLWGVMILLLREFFVTYVRILSAQYGIVIAAGFSGKLKTVVQMIAIVYLMVVPFSIVGTILIVLTILLTLYSGSEYLIASKEFLKSEV